MHYLHTHTQTPFTLIMYDVWAGHGKMSVLSSFETFPLNDCSPLYTISFGNLTFLCKLSPFLSNRNWKYPHGEMECVLWV